MSGGWKPKPGDLFVGAGDIVYYAVEVTENTRTAWRDRFHAIRSDGNGYPVAAIPSARPLVTIDPEDREQVERLSQAYKNQYWDGEGTIVSAAHVDALQAALREFANPTPAKPDEPTGLGAVVEDAKGADWHRTREGRWISVDGLRSAACSWPLLDAVRVLSVGVTE